MAAAKQVQRSLIPPLVNEPYPAPGYENENSPGLGRGDRILEQQRKASGNLDDDPTDSGEPVKNTKPFRITRTR